jgi:hypothetical protein
MYYPLAGLEDIGGLFVQTAQFLSHVNMQQRAILMIMPSMTYTLWPHDSYLGAMPPSLVNTLALLDEPILSRALLRPY